MRGFDIFEVFTNGQVLWHTAATDMTEAQKLAAEKAAQTNNSFLIFDRYHDQKWKVTPSSTPSGQS